MTLFNDQRENIITYQRKQIIICINNTFHTYVHILFRQFSNQKIYLCIEIGQVFGILSEVHSSNNPRIYFN